MNKTVNINLAGTFFHIDEDAFAKLNRYLTAIKRSFSDPDGRDEIIKDIEARIAELFSEKLDTNKQVITIKELDEVIAVMGQPEDYAIDEEMFSNSTNTGSTEQKSAKGYKKLFRDPDNKYIGGVSSGLGHYIGLDAIWLRLIWILLTIFSSGTFILIYIIFWILVPEAVTTADKLTMRGKPVNISNIERKFKETYDNVADKVKNADYDAYGKKIKTGSESFFDTVGKILLALLTVFVKFIGVIIILVAATTLIGLFIGLFITGISGFFGSWYAEAFHIVNDTLVPIWLLSILIFLSIAIPFFFLFILGLKILVDNLKSIGKAAKLTLLGLWLIAVFSLISIGVLQAVEHSNEGSVIQTEELNIKTGDTLYLRMNANPDYEKDAFKSSGFSLKYNENDEQVIYSNNLRLIVRSTKDSLASLMVNKKANGRDYIEAKNRAEAISHNHKFEANNLILDGYFITSVEEKYRDQEIEITLYLPVGSYLFADNNTYSYHRNSSRYRDILLNGQESKYLEIQDGKTFCNDCSEKNSSSYSNDNTDVEYHVIDWDDENWQETWKEGNRIKIDRDGIDINIADERDSVRVKLDKRGIKVKSN
ncbi:MAG: PspC domain-containing protein [Flavobacteriaceae bacterium]|nr:PspC domain-containing protein [Flavobacteriaceae bacterium]